VPPPQAEPQPASSPAQPAGAPPATTPALPQAAKLTTRLTASPDWTLTGTHRGAQIWRHATGAQAAIPITGRYHDDAELIAAAEHAITLTDLGLGPADYPEAVSRLAAIAAIHPSDCTCSHPWPCPTASTARGRT
jgi:hypothetical protein